MFKPCMKEKKTCRNENSKCWGDMNEWAVCVGEEMVVMMWVSVQVKQQVKKIKVRIGGMRIVLV